MVIYLDTSALLKLYVDEPGRALVVEAVAAARVVTSTVTYAEARSGLARRFREEDFSPLEYRAMLTKLDDDWLTFDRLQVSDLVARHAGQLAEAFALRGYDAIHLSSALALSARFGELRFLAFDRRLVDAAMTADVAVYPG